MRTTSTARAPRTPAQAVADQRPPSLAIGPALDGKPPHWVVGVDRHQVVVAALVDEDHVVAVGRQQRNGFRDSVGLHFR